MTLRDRLEGIGFGLLAVACAFVLAVIGVVQAIWWVLALCLLGSWLL